ncbi:CPBP family intramembrane glutamic endopeptidase [Marinoscillum furvescens]|nr:CPBP family intramembrane glutamic endopeptidase [Marinoscillum furvescens]
MIRYLLPGAIPMAVLVAWYLAIGDFIPSILVFIMTELFVTIPVIWYWMVKEQHENFSEFTLKEVMPPQNCVRFGPFFAISSLSLVWALGCFVIFKPVAEYLQETLFYWLPEWFDFSHYLKDYPDRLVKSIWLLLVPISVVLPMAEEFYFRGYLLQKRHCTKGVSAPVVNALLFACYHLWSLWLVPVRLFAMFPVIYFTYKYRNVYLGIVVHVLLNLIGDVVLTYSIIF